MRISAGVKTELCVDFIPALMYYGVDLYDVLLCTSENVP